MNAKTYVKISNVIGLVSIILLVLWVFSYILIEVFDLLIFRKNMTETFMLSIVALIAVLAGALFVNVMFNLTRIADKHNIDDDSKTVSKKAIVGLVMIFPLIASLLFTGNYFSENKKESFMMQSTKNFLSKSTIFHDRLENIEFDEQWVDNLAEELQMFNSKELNFDNPSVLFHLNLEGKSKFYLVKYSDTYNTKQLTDSLPINLSRYRVYYNELDREYYDRVFQQGYKEHRFIRNGNYFKLEFPYTYKGKTVVIRTSDYQQYGKFGS